MHTALSESIWEILLDKKTSALDMRRLYVVLVVLLPLQNIFLRSSTQLDESYITY